MLNFSKEGIKKIFSPTNTIQILLLYHKYPSITIVSVKVNISIYC